VQIPVFFTKTMIEKKNKATVAVKRAEKYHPVNILPALY